MHRLMQRRAGILLHPTSLPGSPGSGDLGMNAYWFVDFLVKSGVTVWQTLPLNPTNADLSPYQSPSAHAGNIRMICLDQLVKWGWLKETDICTEKDVPEPSFAACQSRLKKAYSGFHKNAAAGMREEYQNFIAEQANWLDDYALYLALKLAYEQTPWWEWPEKYRDRDHEALALARREFAPEIEQCRFEQFVFFRQWLTLKRYANERGVLLFGDVPIFVAADSADVWANRENFRVAANGRPEVVAGVPPDYFSATGQLWGNPHYDWDYMQKTGFQWWISRLRTQQQLFDMVRIDHFRGFEAHWEIPYGAPDAMGGHWVKAPGKKLFKTLKAVGTLPLIAEDLGVITPEVTALREHFKIPGMKILQFAFGDGPHNPYLPHNLEPNSVIYTGTHDNNTTLGWFKALTPQQQEHVNAYLGAEACDMPWPLIRCAMASVSNLAIVPLQDLLELDESARMNVPGVAEHNWRWRFSWDQMPAELPQRLHDLLGLYGRLPT